MLHHVVNYVTQECNIMGKKLQKKEIKQHFFAKFWPG